MLKIDYSVLRAWSMLGQRGTYGSILLDIADKNNKIIALSADLCTTSGLDRFRKSHQNRFINVGIAEQNMIGVAAGLASRGFIPFASTFSNFASLRSCEQVRHYMGYMQENVKLVGLAAGFAMGMFGVTHYGIEDIAALRSISNLTIISPCDGFETAKAVNAAANMVGPVYLRLTGTANMPIVYKEDYEFEIGKAKIMRQGHEITLISMGALVNNVLLAADILDAEGIKATVINMHTIKPIDEDILKEYEGSDLVITIEEHSTVGGLGSAVSEYYAQRTHRPRQMRIGVGQGYDNAGDYNYMLGLHGLTPKLIAKRVLLSIKDNQS